MSITVRPATEEYASVITDIGKRVFRETFGPVSPPEELEKYLKESYTTEVQCRELNDPSRYTFIAFNEENTPVGFCQLRNNKEVYDFVNDPEAIELQRVYVDLNCGGKGIGSKLVQEAIRKARDLGKKTIWLGVNETNLPAIALYKKHGFCKAGVHVFKLGDMDDTDDVMVKRLIEA
ncbi:acyl-CoA N-acyltransferase [Backusella circina FSU 941]|nr:acyl-CoA N-acyltransferase [Backusella circina FSU 941]